MQGTRFPSGDPAADRRAGFAETMLHLGDLAAAIEAMKSALDLAPDWAAGWFRLGEWYEAAGLEAEAVSAWDRAILADPADPLGAVLKRDLLRGTQVADTLPPAFVELLFDQYAPRFDTALQDRLGYRGPQIIADALRAAGATAVTHAMDLGCGTGLTGEVLRPLAQTMHGVDISAGMLAEAEAKGLYDRLIKGDIAALPLADLPYDLIVATDVFNYLGALDGVMTWIAGSLAPGGLLAFTVEKGTQGYTLQEARRFAHSPGYVRDLLTQAGLTQITLTDCVLRHDRGTDVMGLTVTARATATQHTREGEDGLETA